MEKYFFRQRPKEVELTQFVISSSLVFHFAISEADNGFEAHEVCVTFTSPSQVNYDSIVSNIVRQRYSADAVEAILNNYLNDPEAGRKEFEELQTWRTQAKEWARKGLELMDKDSE